MTTLYRRKAEVIVQTANNEAIKIESKVDTRGRLLAGLRFRFNVVRTLSHEPNTCELSIWNLNETHRAQLAEQQTAKVIVQAGYEERTSLIFTGDLRETRIERQGPDIVTTISSGDGETGHRRGRINQSFGAGTNIRDVISGIVDSMDIGEGNLSDFTDNFSFENVAQQFVGGFTASGQSSRVLERLVVSAGLEYSIQDGVLQLVQRNRPLGNEAIKLTSDSGLLGSPTKSSDGLVEARSLFIPDLFPGRKVQLDSEQARGFYRIEKAEYNGDMSGEYAIKMECQEV